MSILTGCLIGIAAWAIVRFFLMGVYTVDQNERALKTAFGRAERVPGGKTTLDLPIAEHYLEEAASLLAIFASVTVAHD